MNQMNLMNQMNQMNQINNNDNLENEIIKNNQKLNSKKFYINLDQINLINSIIDFYKKNDKEYMNFNEKVQIMKLINHLNSDFSKIKEINNDDPLHYIEEEKINIKFINRDKVLYNVRIPISINKKDLYSIAEKYKSFYFTKFLLIHKNSIIDNDESSIEFLSKDDIIIIVEDRYYQDNSYYNSLIENKNFKDMIEINLKNTYELCGQGVIQLFFPPYITFSQMMKAIYFKFDRDEKDLFLINYPFIKGNNIIIQDIFNNKRRDIDISTGSGVLGGILNKYGKLIDLNFPGYTINIGILNSNKKLVKDIEYQEEKKVKKIYIKGKELNIKEEKSLSSLGINENCSNCIVEFEEKNYQ